MNSNSYYYGDNKYPKDSVIASHITSVQLGDVYNFNNKMLKEGYLRPTREGGKLKRNSKQESKDNKEGKIAEFAVYNFLTEHNIKCTKPTLWVGSKNEFDTGYDLYAQLKHGGQTRTVNIEVKGSTLKAKSLMLEAKRWQIYNNKLVNMDHPNIHVPDMFITVNVDSPKIAYKKFLTDDANNSSESNLMRYCKYNNVVDLFVREGMEVPKVLITGVLFKDDLIDCVTKNESLFKKHIPTSYYLQKIDAPNYVFPYFYSKRGINPKLYKISNIDPDYIHTMRKPADGFKIVWPKLNI